MSAMFGIAVVPIDTRKRIMRAATALLLSIAATPICAQTAASTPHRPPPKTMGQVRIGSVYFTPTIGLQNIGIETTLLDSGLFGQGTSGQRQTALVFSVFLGENIALVGRKLSVSTDIGVDYATTSRQAATTPSFSLSLHGVSAEYVASPRLTFTGNGNYATTMARPSFEIDSRVRRRDASLGTGVQFSLTPRLRAGIQSQWSRVRYDESATYLGVELAHSLNQSRFDLTTTLDCGLTSWTGVFVPVSWRRNRFDFETGRNGDTVSVGVGARFSPRGLLSGSLEAGRVSLRLQNGVVPDYSGWYHRGVTTVAFRDTTAVEFSSQRNISLSYDVVRAYYAYQWNGVFVRQRIGQRFDIGPSYNWYSSRYIGSSTPSDTTRVWGGILGYARGRARYDVYVSYWDRGANSTSGTGYNRWRFGFRIQTHRVNISERGIFANGPMGIGVIQP